jgi:BirA family biotin operon repressor/biotin-[acetyl-CoA-carboxylase] ligase
VKLHGKFENKMKTLHSQRIKSGLSAQSQSLLNQIHVFKELDSTNNWLLENKGCMDVCLAEKQIAGRGRRGRSWSSPETGNIYLSLSWCFNDIPEYFPLISLLTGVAVCEVLQSQGLQGHGLKWPNDILVKEKKLAGILVETSGSLQRVVIGIGLNLSSCQQDNIDQPWCSLDDVMDCVPSREDLVIAIIDQVVSWLLRLDTLSFNEFNQHWDDWDITVNRDVSILQHVSGGAGQTINGIAKGIDQQGCIMVQLSDGTLQSYFSGEVSLRC